jgi:hypothetical protein
MGTLSHANVCQRFHRNAVENSLVRANILRISCGACIRRTCQRLDTTPQADVEGGKITAAEMHTNICHTPIDTQHVHDSCAGAQCENDCGCNGHGKCAGDGKSCLCDKGWKYDSVQKQCVWDCVCPDGEECAGPGVCACSPGCVKGTCVRGRCACWAGFAGPTCSLAVDRPNKNSPIGINVAAPGYGTHRVFVDVMKHSSGWVSVPGQDMTNNSGAWWC